jgi:hypothetical protein
VEYGAASWGRFTYPAMAAARRCQGAQQARMAWDLTDETIGAE